MHVEMGFTKWGDFISQASEHKGLRRSDFWGVRFYLPCNVFCIFILCLNWCMYYASKGMVESCLLSKDELLTPNIDEVMTV